MEKMSIRISSTLLACLLMGTAGARGDQPKSASGGEDVWRKALPNTAIEAIRPDPRLPGIYEIVMGDKVVYGDATGRYLMFGHLFDVRTQQDLTQQHLDHCLTCRSCETTCPSGVRYARLADIGREIVDRRVGRPLAQRLMRYALRKIVPYPERFGLLLALGRAARPLLPQQMRRQLPPLQHDSARPAVTHKRRMLVLEGCVQKTATPNTNAAAARILDRLGISLISDAAAGCCGAVSHHLSESEEARRAMRRNIDAWWPHIEAGAEAIVISASGCGVMVKEYGDLLREDPVYAEKATTVAALARDIGEVVATADLQSLPIDGRGRAIAFHAPCTLHHGQKLPGVVEGILRQFYFKLIPVADS
ncbi:MAG: glycolate oxidase subunit GlcF, partial [Candidatus Thiodiazotropha sp.]